MKNFLRGTQTPGLPEVPQSSSFLGRIKSAFRSRLNRRTILDNTAEAEAYRLYLEELERLPEAKLKKDRAVEHYLQHRDDIIRSDHEQHVRQMRKERMQRQLDAERNQIKIARVRRQEQLSKAKTRAERAQFVLDTFTATAPHNKGSEGSSLKGAAHAALDLIALLQTLREDEEADDASATSRPRTLQDELAYIEKLIDECQSKTAPEQMYLLYNIRAQLTAS